MFHRIIVAIDGPDGERDANALAHRLAAEDAEYIAGHIPGGQDVATGLYELAASRSADLLVLAAPHHRHLWGADPTRATLRDAPCPVAVAPDRLADNRDPSVRSIGVGYNENDPESDAALELAQELASQLAAEVHVTHVVPETNWEAADSGAGRQAVLARERLAAIGGVITVAEGDVHRALVELEQEVDLLVLGSHHHGTLHRIVGGDTVAGLVRALACPLLVVPHTAPQS